MAEGRIRRRLAAIISADVVGYSQTMGRDEAGTLARLKSLRSQFPHPRVAERGERIVKTAGDGAIPDSGGTVHSVVHTAQAGPGMTEFYL